MRLSGLKILAQNLLPFLAVLGIFSVVIAFQAPHLAKLKHQNSSFNKSKLVEADTTIKAQLSLIKSMPSFGFDNLIADLYFLNFLQYFRDVEARQQTGYGIASDYFDVILDRDPRFIQAYYYLANTASIYLGNPEQSVERMERGLKSFSVLVPDKGYYVWKLKAIDELIFLGKVSAARSSLLTTVKWSSQYPDPERQHVARSTQSTVNYLATNPNLDRSRFEAWNLVLNSAVDRTAIDRAIIETKLLRDRVNVDAKRVWNIEQP
jgi:tetratricopeptide (TPR) repeat protein